jgi:hypothetical protein
MVTASATESNAAGQARLPHLELIQLAFDSMVNGFQVEISIDESAVSKVRKMGLPPLFCHKARGIQRCHPRRELEIQLLPAVAAPIAQPHY